MSSSPAAGAIGIAAGVIAVALAVQAAASVADAWPTLILAALGAALGAGIAINAIGARDFDPPQPPPAADGPTQSTDTVRVAIVNQGLVAIIVLCIVAAGWTEDARWWTVAAAAGVGWAWTLSRLAWRLDIRPPRGERSVYPRAYQLGLLVFALWLVYGAVAADTPWLWHPGRWDDYQGPIWLVVLELAGLPITLLAGQVR